MNGVTRFAESRKDQPLVRAILNRTGMLITEDKLYLLENRLTEVMEEYGIASFDQVAYLLENGTDSFFAESVIEKITTHETRFFREESVFDALVLQIIPEWIEKNQIRLQGNSDLRFDIWSAGCSTGQEVYSIAIAIREKFPTLAPRIRILGTDLSAPTLEKAISGLFNQFEIDRGMPPRLLARYFEKRECGYRITDEIRNMVRFQHHNLITCAMPGTFDVIFCRNVCIYFQEYLRRAVYQGLVNALKQDGSLVLGAVESLVGYASNFVIRECGLARYYEANCASVTMF